MKRSRLFTLPLLLCLLLPLLAGCAKEPTYATAAPTIPEGWEAVSTDGAITHLQMKEGEDAYYWMDATSLKLEESNSDPNIFTAVHIAGNDQRAPLQADKDRNIYFIIYYGVFYTQRIDQSYGTSIDVRYELTDPPEEASDASHKLYIERAHDDIIGNLSTERIYSDPWELSEAELNQVEYQMFPQYVVDSNHIAAKVGLTQAIIYACPLDLLESTWTTMIFRLSQSTDESREYSSEYSEDFSECYRAYQTVYFNTQNLPAPDHPLFVDWFWIITQSLIICSIILTIVCFIRKKNILIQMIPIFIGAVYNIFALFYASQFPTSRDQWTNDLTSNIILAFVLYFIVSLLLAIVRLLLCLIRWVSQKIRMGVNRAKTKT